MQATYDKLLSSTTCAQTAEQASDVQLACIRALPIQEFREATGGGMTGLVADGDLLDVGSALDAYKKGNWVKVPHLIGSNTDEGWSFGARGANTTEQTKALLAGLVPSEHLDALLRLYPDVPALGCPFNTGDLQPSAAGAVDFFSSAEMPSGLQNKRVAAIVGDVMLAAGPRWLAQVASREVAVFKYRFNHVPYSTSSGVQDYVGHFVEVPYVFNLQNDETAFWKEHGCTATYLGPGAPTGDRSLGIAMSRAWASFIATGDPNEANVPGQTHWPPYSEGARNLVWQTRGSVVENDNYREEGIQFIVENIVF
ncbi:unnamed protein product [Mycena citricolor]|uniref:Carboxylesterase type B domain-containing protein n=1 Tax=Mycena citricolor TaxID=2018698 RepID=A0AAD2HAQ7_9AGAR|nr:unnamed protein product [Mycena citricolor]